jgi:hypothetical protein
MPTADQSLRNGSLAMKSFKSAIVGFSVLLLLLGRIAEPASSQETRSSCDKADVELFGTA